MFIAICAAVGGVIEASQNNWTLDAFFRGALKGAAFGAAVIGISYGVGGLENGLHGFSAPSTSAEITAGVLGIPAAIGTFDPNANSSLNQRQTNFTATNIEIREFR